MSRKCACPLAEPMDSMPLSVKYRHGDRCRKRAYRAKVNQAATAAGLRVAPSLAAVQAMGSTGGRDGHAQAARDRPIRRRKPGLRVSYRKALAELTEQFTPKPPEGYGIPQPVLAGALERALTPLQRAQLDRQETTS